MKRIVCTSVADLAVRLGRKRSLVLQKFVGVSEQRDFGPQAVLAVGEVTDVTA